MMVSSFLLGVAGPGSAMSFVIWVSQWEDEESAGPVPGDALECAVNLGDPGEVEQADGDVP
jgi:hypothetical protein